MKKQPGVNGEWVPVSLQERRDGATLPSLVALGTPVLVHLQHALSDGWGERGWILPAVIWVYGLLFWLLSSGRQLLAARRWEWTAAAQEERLRHWSDARKTSRTFWGHWWVRFPIGLVFLSYGVHALESSDFSMQWLGMVLLMSAFVTPFVFVAELALLPLVILALLAYLTVAEQMPIALIVMLAGVAMVFSLLAVLARRGTGAAAPALTPAPAAPASMQATPPEAAVMADSGNRAADAAQPAHAAIPAGQAKVVAALPLPREADTLVSSAAVQPGALSVPVKPAVQAR